MLTRLHGVAGTRTAKQENTCELCYKHEAIHTSDSNSDLQQKRTQTEIYNNLVLSQIMLMSGNLQSERVVSRRGRVVRLVLITTSKMVASCAVSLRARRDNIHICLSGISARNRTAVRGRVQNTLLTFL